MPESEALAAKRRVYDGFEWLMLASHPDVPWKPIHPSSVELRHRHRMVQPINHFGTALRQKRSPLQQAKK